MRKYKGTISWNVHGDRRVEREYVAIVIPLPKLLSSRDTALGYIRAHMEALRKELCTLDDILEGG